MTLIIKPSNLFDDNNFIEFKKVLSGRINDADSFQIDLENTILINSSKFNDLIQIYEKFKEFGKHIHYINTHHSFERFIDESNFHKPFDCQ